METRGRIGRPGKRTDEGHSETRGDQREAIGRPEGDQRDQRETTGTRGRPGGDSEPIDRR